MHHRRRTNGIGRSTIGQDAGALTQSRRHGSKLYRACGKGFCRIDKHLQHRRRDQYSSPCQHSAKNCLWQRRTSQMSRPYVTFLRHNILPCQSGEKKQEVIPGAVTKSLAMCTFCACCLEPFVCACENACHQVSVISFAGLYYRAMMFNPDKVHCWKGILMNTGVAWRDTSFHGTMGGASLLSLGVRESCLLKLHGPRMQPAHKCILFSSTMSMMIRSCARGGVYCPQTPKIG